MTALAENRLYLSISLQARSIAAVFSGDTRTGMARSARDLARGYCEPMSTTRRQKRHTEHTPDRIVAAPLTAMVAANDQQVVVLRRPICMQHPVSAQHNMQFTFNSEQVATKLSNDTDCVCVVFIARNVVLKANDNTTSQVRTQHKHE